MWEPVIDRWYPSLSHTSWPQGSSIDIKSDRTLQLTVSGIMLERVLQTYSLFFHSEEDAERQNVPDVLISNSLGSGIDFDLYDSATNSKLMTVKDGEVKAVVHFNRQLNANHISSLVDVRFLGEFGEQREHLLQLPFNINRPKICNLHYCSPEDIPSGSPKVKKMRPTVLEPIVEEVFENARYDPITARYEERSHI